MAEQTGTLKVNGKVGGLIFYRAYGKDLVRKAAGPSAASIKSNPNYARTRENLMEFGGCSRMAKSFRLSMAGVKRLCDGQFGNRITKLLKLVCNENDGTRGQRPVLLSKYRHWFKNFEGQESLAFKRVLEVNLQTTYNGRTEAVVMIPMINLEKLHAPTGATHFRLVQTLAVVSDFVYDDAMKAYRPVDVDANEVSALTWSEYISMQDNTIPSLTLTTKLDEPLTLTENVSVVHAVGIAFYQETGSIPYPLEHGFALKVLEVY